MRATAPQFSETIQDDLWSDVRRRLEKETGMDLSKDREPRLHQAFDSVLREMLRAGRVDSPEDFRRLLADTTRHASVLERLVSYLTVGETFFFRNADHFRALRDRIIPEIIRTGGEERTLRIWSAGCSTGEEPYSVAILLDRDFPILSDWDVSILATDISREYLTRAEAGRYRAWSFRGTDVLNDPRYFRLTGDEFLIADRIRSRVRFRWLNFVHDVYPSALTQTVGLDLIVFRNVAIYLRPEVTREILRRFARCLRPGGYLLLGETDFRRDLLSESDFDVIRDGETMLLRRPVTSRPSAREILLPPILPPILPPAPPRAVGREEEAAAIELAELEAFLRRPSVKPAPPAFERFRALRESGEWETAAELLPELPAGRPRGEAALLLARSALATGSSARARELADRAVAEEPLLVEGHLLLGCLREEAGELESAAAALRKAVYLDHGNPTPYFLLGIVLSRAGAASESARALGNARDLAARLPASTPLPHGEGLVAGRLVQILDEMGAVS